MNGNDRVGFVKLERLHLLKPDHATVGSERLSSIQMQEPRPPDSAELDMSKHEGKAITVRGNHGDGWIYSVEVID